MKSVHIRSFSGPYFPAFGLNTWKNGPEKLWIRTLFTQWMSQCSWAGWSEVSFAPMHRCKSLVFVKENLDRKKKINQLWVKCIWFKIVMWLPIRLDLLHLLWFCLPFWLMVSRLIQTVYSITASTLVNSHFSKYSVRIMFSVYIKKMVNGLWSMINGQKKGLRV